MNNVSTNFFKKNLFPNILFCSVIINFETSISQSINANKFGYYWQETFIFYIIVTKKSKVITFNPSFCMKSKLSADRIFKLSMLL